MRIHQHVNPLSSKYLIVPEIPNWSEVFRDIYQPLHLDLGSAAGHFLLKMAQQQPGWNFLGVEIRKPLVDRANRWKDEQGLDNVFFFFGQVHVVLEPLLKSLPPDVVQCVTVNFPDPWFKKRHHKRRMINSHTVRVLAEYLPVGCKIFVQTDVGELMDEIKMLFANEPRFALEQDEMDHTPFPIPTEREISVSRLGRKIYRTMFSCVEVKNKVYIN